jgi:nucleoid DNA-binding protein
MLQSELISTIAERTEFGKGQVTRMITTLVEVCRGELIAEGEVRLSDLGKLSTKVRQARNGLNPQTGEKIQIAPKRRAVFTAAKSLRDELNVEKPVARGRRRA